MMGCMGNVPSSPAPEHLGPGHWKAVEPPGGSPRGGSESLLLCPSNCDPMKLSIKLFMFGLSNKESNQHILHTWLCLG